MDKKTYSNLIVSSSPHIVSNTDTTRIMAMVLLALAPAFLVSIYVFGFRVVPLTLILPHMFGLGTTGVFLAEPISNFIGGAACYITMLLTIWPELNRKKKEKECLAKAAEA